MLSGMMLIGVLLFVAMLGGLVLVQAPWWWYGVLVVAAYVGMRADEFRREDEQARRKAHRNG